MFTFNAIAPFNASPPAGCSAFGPDSRYLDVVRMTGGVSDDICTPDWSKTLEALGKTAFGFRTNFFLNGVPDLSGGRGIEVRIDNRVIDPKDSRGATVWQYDSAANSINFEPIYVPAPGQTLTITYYVACNAAP